MTLRGQLIRVNPAPVGALHSAPPVQKGGSSEYPPVDGVDEGGVVAHGSSCFGCEGVLPHPPVGVGGVPPHPPDDRGGGTADGVGGSSGWTSSMSS